MPKIYQQLIDKAVITGAITPQQYLQIPWNERENMQYLFSFRMQWILTRGITFEQYMQLLLNYRKITQGVNSMTFEQFLALRWYERSRWHVFFHPMVNKPLLPVLSHLSNIYKYHGINVKAYNIFFHRVGDELLLTVLLHLSNIYKSHGIIAKM